MRSATGFGGFGGGVCGCWSQAMAVNSSPISAANITGRTGITALLASPAHPLARSSARLLFEATPSHLPGDDGDAPVIGGKEPLPPESRRRMRSRMAGNKLVAITCLLTKASAPLSEAMSR
jgi:hypothetical protein